MSNLPALNYISNSFRTEGEAKVAFEDQLASVKQIPGAGVAETTLTIASGSITPPSGGPGIFKVETEASGATDDLTNIVQTNIPDGSLIWIRCANAARVVTVKSSAGGAGQAVMQASIDVALNDTKKWICLKRTGTLWEELYSSTLFSPLLSGATVVAAPEAALGVANRGYIDSVAASIQDFRLTLQSGTPISTTDQNARTTVYASPQTGYSIALYNGAAWVVRQSAEMSIAIPASASTIFDVFCYDAAGTAALEVLAWTNDTTRATGLVRQNGILVKSGATTRRYLGSFRTTTVAGQCEDSVLKRYLWNYYHRADRTMQVLDGTNTWTYTTATWRQANTAAGSQLDCVIGWAEDPVEVFVQGLFNSSTSTASAAVGIGVNSTTVNSAFVFTGGKGETGSTHRISVQARYRAFPALGRTYYPWLEISEASGTTTWYGDNGGVLNQSGIMGVVRG